MLRQLRQGLVALQRHRGHLGLECRSMIPSRSLHRRAPLVRHHPVASVQQDDHVSHCQNFRDHLWRYQVKSTIDGEKIPETRKRSGGDSKLGLGLDGWHNGPGWPSHECSVSP